MQQLRLGEITTCLLSILLEGKPGLSDASRVSHVQWVSPAFSKLWTEAKECQEKEDQKEECQHRLQEGRQI